ncbi:MAG: PH domain-containing protein [Thermodesulfobacteriota bacterium]
MGGYINKTLIPGETVIFQTRLHKFIYIAPVIMFAALSLLGFAVILQVNEFHNIGYLFFPAAALPIAVAYLAVFSSEFAVTNKRVVIKKGLIRQSTVDLMFDQIASLSVDQDIFGRIMNFGTLRLVSSAGWMVVFKNIEDALSFRNALYSQLTH